MTTTDDELVAQMQQRSRSFDAWAVDYDRYRPGYPQTLFDHVANRLDLPADARVADLGAGTGKAALAMARRGWRVTAIEPGQGMLDVLGAQAAAAQVRVEARRASAEETGLDSVSVDLVTAAQAFHWFDKEKAMPEIARIVRPGGGVAVFWNARADDRSAFLSGHMDVLSRYVPEAHLDRRNKDDDSTTSDDLGRSGWFAADPRVILEHEVVMSIDDFVQYAFTASYIRLFVEPHDQVRLRTELREQASRFAIDGAVTVALDVDVYVGRRV